MLRIEDLPPLLTCISKHTDLEWRNRLMSIQDAASRARIGSGVVRNGFKVARNGVKRSKGAVIPELQTFRANEV